MPETAVDEESDPRSDEHDIDPTPRVRKEGSIHQETETDSMKGGANR